MKRMMIFALAAVMLFGMVGCSNDPVETEPTTIPTTASTEPVETTAPVEETTTPAETEPVETTVPETEAPTEPSEPAPTKPKGNGGNSGNQGNGNGSNHGDEADPDEWLNTDPTDPPHTHSYATTVVKPTCESKGYTEYKCACGHSYTANEVAPTGHTWGAWVVIKEATIGREGEKMQECQACAKRRSEKIPAEIAPSEPMPTEPQTEPTEPVPTKPVPPEPTEPQTEPTEPAPTKPTEPPHEHKYTKNVVKPTCENKGYTEYKCACGDSYTADEKDATGHQWDNGKVTTKPTTEEEGEKTFTCKVCGKTRKEVLPKEEKPKQEVIDVAAIEAYGRSYAASVGFVVDTSLGFSNAGYYPCGTGSIQTMQKGYSSIAGYTAAVRNRLMAADYSNNRTDSPDVFRPYRYNCKVEYSHTDEQGNQWYTFTVFYG